MGDRGLVAGYLIGLSLLCFAISRENRNRAAISAAFKGMAGLLLVLMFMTVLMPA